MNELLKYIEGACLTSFRNENQFLEIEFTSELYEEIIFFIDCSISSSIDKVNEIVDELKKYDPDVADLAFFIPANNIEVKAIFFDNIYFQLWFSNDYKIVFHLEEFYDEPLSISFKKMKSDDKYESVSLSINNV